MPINGFGGGPGSGKTYGVMEHVILPAIANGRFILTNIEGLNPEAIYQYVVDKAPAGKIICVGHIRTCDRGAPEDDEFFPGEYALDKPMPVPDPEFPRVCGGDLVVIDEATRYWSTGDKVKRSHAYFFREHRHFANEMGHTCDMVVIDPDLSLLARQLKGKLEMASVTHKPKEIGLNRYVVNIYPRGKVSGKPMQTLGPYGFKPEIYNLYKSYSHEKAKEQAIDGRQNVFRNPRLWAFAAGILLMGGLSIWAVYHLIWGKAMMKDAPKDATPATAAAISGPAGTAPAPVQSNRSDALRVVGEVTLNGEHWIAVSDGNGRLRLENPAAFVGRGVFLVGTVEGKRVTAWSGAQPIQATNVPQVGGK